MCVDVNLVSRLVPESRTSKPLDVCTKPNTLHTFARLCWLIVLIGRGGSCTRLHSLDELQVITYPRLASVSISCWHQEDEMKTSCITNSLPLLTKILFCFSLCLFLTFCSHNSVLNKWQQINHTLFIRLSQNTHFPCLLGLAWGQVAFITVVRVGYNTIS